MALSRNQEALTRLERVDTLDPKGIWSLADMAQVQFRLGRSAAARATHQRLVKLAEQRWVPPLAFVHASEDVETRLEWLERAFEAHDSELIFLEVDPAFDDLRGQPRFQAVVDQVRAATVR